MRILLTAIYAGLLSGLCSAQLPDQTVPNTLGVNIKDYSSSTADIEAIHEAGARFIRKGVYWTRVEKEKGVYDFSWYDRLVEDAENNGLFMLGVLYGGNDLYENDGLGGIQTEEGRQGFAAFGAALAEHFKDHNIIWEIWNEPNVRTFWNQEGTHNSDEFAEEYTALVKATAAAMVQADPECFVVAGSVSNFWEPSYYWTNACFQRGIGESGISGWSVHPYGLKTPEEYAIGYRRTREIFMQNNIPYDFPILDSERGFSLEKLDEGWSGGDVTKAEEYQAWHFVRQYMVDLLYDIKLSIWYEWDGEKFGVVYGNEKRASYFACTNMVDELEGYTFAERLYTTSPNDYLLLFENASGKQKLVAWTAPPAGSSPDQYIAHEVEIPRNVKNKVEVKDIYGKETYFKIRNGKVNIELTGSPKYINLIGPSHNAGLSAILWPDVPESVLPNQEWKHDTIPGFARDTLYYTLRLSEEIDKVPDLLALTQDRNAQVSVLTAKTLDGPLADRITTIQVTAEDDTTMTRYQVEFRRTFIQPIVWSHNYLIDNDSLSISGISTGTVVDSFLARLIADSTNYVYQVLSHADGSEKIASDVLAEGDTLRVQTADLSDVTDYLLYISDSGLDNNAVLTSTSYTVETNGSKGEISGFPYGVSIQSVLDNIDIPETAELSVVQDTNDAVPLKMLNYDNAYVPAQVNTAIIFRVTAQDMQTVIDYRLKPDTSSGDIYVYSNVLKVDQPSRIIASIPDELSVSMFLSKLWASREGSIRVVDKYGHERLMETVTSDYYVVVSDNSGTIEKKYRLQMLNEAEGIYAYVCSDIYTVDQEERYIYGIADTIEINEFLDALYPSLNAGLKVIDAAGNEKSTGVISPGEDKLQVTSGNGETTVMYKLYTKPMYPVTILIGNGADPVGEAILIINDDTLTSNQNGMVNLMLPNGDYEYYASKEDYSASGNITVGDTAQSVEIIIRRVTYPLNITVMVGSGPVSNAIIMIDGTYYMSNTEGAVTVDLTSGEYYYTVTVSGYDDQSGYITIADSAQHLNIRYEPLSIGRESSQPMDVYPNPSGGEISIRIAGNTDPMELRIFTAHGELIYDKHYNSSTENVLDLRGLEQGIYFMQIQTGEQVTQRKIIIE